MRKSTIVFGGLLVALYLVFSSVYIVDQRQNALVLQFGQVKAVKDKPGLFFKIPFIQKVIYYDHRILSIDTATLEVTPLDDRRLIVDAFARYRIVDLIRFRQAVGEGGIPRAEARLDRILRAQTRQVLGSVTSTQILSSDRTKLMARIRDAARSESLALGLEILDVRLKRSDLPDQNLAATFARMRAERDREAADQIARGKEAAQKIRAQADRTRVETVSDAKRKAEITRGEADGKRTAILAKAYGADPEFFAFYRSLRAYETALTGATTTMVLRPDGEFFKYLKSEKGK